MSEAWMIMEMSSANAIAFVLGMSNEVRKELRRMFHRRGERAEPCGQLLVRCLVTEEGPYVEVITRSERKLLMMLMS